MTLDAMRALLSRLGDPQTGRRTVHVTGSKGKGSTSTMIASILHQAGQKTALYMSPHLHTYRERMQLDSQPVPQESFAEAAERIRQSVEDEHNGANGPIVTFGILTAIFFELAKMYQAKWQVVEVGLGGTLDATNVFEKKEITVITPISLEHAAILGNTPAEIATHKAGIIISGSTAVLAPQKDPLVRSVVKARCDQVGAEFVDVGENYKCDLLEYDSSAQRVRIQSEKRDVITDLSLLGPHQAVNAMTAAAVADALTRFDLTISDKTLRESLSSATIPGRMEILRQTPVVLVDGAHNGESAACLRETLKKHCRFSNCVLVIGVNKDKDVRTMLEELSPVVDRIIATRSKNARAMDPEQVASFVASKPVSTAASVEEALKQALSVSIPETLVCATGSLAVVAEAREFFLSLGPSD
jgi:dihydrofolate synthase/folylpolyglutamate synthase